MKGLEGTQSNQHSQLQAQAPNGIGEAKSRVHDNPDGAPAMMLYVDYPAPHPQFPPLSACILTSPDGRGPVGCLQLRALSVNRVKIVCIVHGTQARKKYEKLPSEVERI
jgi:hypothetical protein